MRTRTRFLLVSTVLAFAGAQAPAQAATKAKPKAAAGYPEITSISPRSLRVGEVLTIRGKNFRPGALKTTVAFYRSKLPVVFLKAEKATKTKLTVTVGPKVLTLFKDDATKPQLIRLRILTTKFGKRWTPNSRSVTIDPIAKQPEVGGGGATPGQVLTCPEKAALYGGNDEDGDHVDNLRERTWGMDPCVADTDGDGVSDGFEVWSAIFLNRSYRNHTPELPVNAFNGRQPWPNPLNKDDAVKDFDGDGLTQAQEYALWVAGGSPFPIFNYTDGEQRTGVQDGIVTSTAVPGDKTALDLDRNGFLTDDELDFDGDGISNMIEFNTRGTQKWWEFQKWRKPRSPSETIVEVPYGWRMFSDLDATVADSDGDGIADGRDDQDEDGFNNVVEMQYSRLGLGVRIHPFNPCLPDLHALNCGRYGLQGGGGWPPYDGDASKAPTVLCEANKVLPSSSPPATACPPSSIQASVSDWDYEIVRWTENPSLTPHTAPQPVFSGLASTGDAGADAAIDAAVNARTGTGWDGETGRPN